MEQWTAREGGIRSIQEGTAGAVAARRVWRAAFDNGSEDQTLLAPLVAAGLRISRFPAEPVVVVTGNLVQGLKAHLAVLAEGVEQSISGADDCDQTIINGCWYPIDRDAVAQLIDALSERSITFGSPLRIVDLIWMQNSDDIQSAFIDRTNQVSAEELSSTTPSESVDGLVASLFSYQAKGVAFLKLISNQGLGCILGDEMGLGKTLQVIGLFQLLSNEGRSPSLVICPATLLENWRRELALFAPRLKVLVHAGDKRSGTAQAISGYDVVVTSYETSIRDEPFLSTIPWKVLAVDEAQNIKNPDAQRTLCVKRYPRDVSIAITGTPVENRLTDLWSIADFALPGILGSVRDFEAEFDDTHEDAARLAPLAAPILLRRRVADVATDLPPRIDIPQPIEMPAGMARHYEAIRQQTLDEFPKSGALVALTRLRMFSAHPQLVMPWANDPTHQMPKFTRLMEIIEEIFASGEKALVFSTYNSMADLIVEHFKKRFGHAFVDLIDGRVDVPQRQAIVDNFTQHGGYGALVLNPKAAGTGLNITTANHVIHYNPEWNPAVEDQASARAYRRKQTRPVTVHHLFFADTVEEVMVNRLHFKRGLAEQAGTGNQGGMDAADLLRAVAVSPSRG